MGRIWSLLAWLAASLVFALAVGLVGSMLPEQPAPKPLVKPTLMPTAGPAQPGGIAALIQEENPGTLRFCNGGSLNGFWQNGGSEILYLRTEGSPTTIVGYLEKDKVAYKFNQRLASNNYNFRLGVQLTTFEPTSSKATIQVQFDDVCQQLRVSYTIPKPNGAESGGGEFSRKN